MPFPALALSASRSNQSEATGVPDNGSNTFAHNWALDVSQIDPDLLEVDVFLNGTVTAAALVGTGLSADRLSVVVNFTQGGGDTVRVIARHVHTVVA